MDAADGSGERRSGGGGRRLRYDPAVSRSTALVELWRPGASSSGQLDEQIDGLAEILRAVVHDGAGVSFILPFSMEDARLFWRETVLPSARAGTRRVLIASVEDRLAGTVQLDLATPPNQRHPAEVMKLLVHPSFRRRGLARALMLALEPVAREEGRSLLTLDTWTGGAAERLYSSLGYVTVGVIPRFARPSTTSGLEPTTIMFKELG